MTIYCMEQERKHNMKKKLFIGTPLLETYGIYSIVSSIISKYDVLPWHYNNFINIYYHQSYYFYFFLDGTITSNNCPWLDINVVDYGSLKNIFNNRFTDFVISCIDQERYVMLYVDIFYVPGTYAYMNLHETHTICIYGYDTKRKVFHVAENLFNNGKFGTAECSFDNLVTSFEKVCLMPKYFGESKDKIFIYKPCDYKHFYFDVLQVRSQLEDYLLSRHVLCMEYKNIDKTPFENITDKSQHPNIYGLKTIEFFLENIDERLVLDDGHFDYRPLHLFYEQKMLMSMRLKYMESNNHGITTKLCQSFDELRDKSLIIRNQALKYNATRNRNSIAQNRILIDKIKQNISLGIQQEKDLYQEILAYL